MHALRHRQTIKRNILSLSCNQITCPLVCYYQITIQIKLNIHLGDRTDAFIFSDYDRAQTITAQISQKTDVFCNHIKIANRLASA